MSSHQDPSTWGPGGWGAVSYHGSLGSSDALRSANIPLILIISCHEAYYPKYNAWPRATTTFVALMILHSERALRKMAMSILHGFTRAGMWKKTSHSQPGSSNNWAHVETLTGLRGPAASALLADWVFCVLCGSSELFPLLITSLCVLSCRGSRFVTRWLKITNNAQSQRAKPSIKLALAHPRNTLLVKATHRPLSTQEEQTQVCGYWNGWLVEDAEGTRYCISHEVWACAEHIPAPVSQDESTPVPWATVSDEPQAPRPASVTPPPHFL